MLLLLLRLSGFDGYYLIFEFQHFCHLDCQWFCEAWTHQTFWCWCLFYTVSLSIENYSSSVCAFRIATCWFLHQSTNSSIIDFICSNSMPQIRLEFEGGGVKAHVGPYTAVPIYIYLHLYWWLSLSLIVCATDYPKVTFFTCKVGMHPLTHSLCEVFTLECLFTKTWENCQSNK